MSPDRLTSIRTPTLSPKPYEMTALPTSEQYKAIETSYLDSLSSKRHPKALIPQALFDVLIGASDSETRTCAFIRQVSTLINISSRCL